MHRGTTHFLAIAASMALSASTVLAQGTMNASGRPLQLGGVLGGTMPLGDFGDAADVGFHIGAIGGFANASWPFSLRGEVVYHRNSLQDIDAHSSILSFVPNIVVPFGLPEATTRPYVIGGVGLNRVSLKSEVAGVEFSDTETKFGFNVGGGVTFNLSGFNTFIEARFHSVLTDDGSTNFIPISFGFLF